MIDDDNDINKSTIGIAHESAKLDHSVCIVFCELWVKSGFVYLYSCVQRFPLDLQLKATNSRSYRSLGARPIKLFAVGLAEKVTEIRGPGSQTNSQRPRFERVSKRAPALVCVCTVRDSRVCE
jgi:hypothetical protein